MKRFAFLLTTLATLSLSAQEVQLVVTEVDNGGFAQGKTYRVYAQLPSAEYSVHAVYAFDENPIVIQSTAPFYQHPYAGNTTRDVVEAIVSNSPGMAYDSWVTIGKENATANELWDVGINFSAFNEGTELIIPDGAWFLVPTSEQTKAQEGNLILLMQYTTTGDVTGTINLQGWTGPQTTWQATGLTFSTTQLSVMGCTNPAASNFNASATVDDGSCENVQNTTPNVPVATADKGEKGWSIFPNPVMEGQINIQFDDVIETASGNSVSISIYEVSGKLVMSKEIGSEEIIGGNRIILNAKLAAGPYQVAVQQGENVRSEMIIVQ